ncbi:uncharacterized protein LOC116431160 isoform X2 [Nomia melanderi]|nr:uncharacterized protein LOC116431160 isoform X2 [Nomia melanderi]
MLAIRNRDIKTVKFLLQNNADVNKSTYLGMSVLGLAAAIDANMFQTVYEACPSALLNSMHDDITPLCIAAMKNDKELFFKLLDLGFEISKINEYTHITMKLSTVPEIRNLAEKSDVEDYWSDISDNISTEVTLEKKELLHSFKSIKENQKKYDMQTLQNIQNECNKKDKNDNIVPFLSSFKNPTIVFHPSEEKNDGSNKNIIENSNQCIKRRPSTLNLVVDHINPIQSSIISPVLTCTLDIPPASPNIYFTQNNYDNEVNTDVINNVKNESLIQDKNKTPTEYLECNECLQEPHLQRLQSIRPPDLNIQNDQEDLDATLTFTPKFSPIRSPHVPADLNDENVFGEDTPTPPHYRTPPRGMILNSEETKMCILLQHHGLHQHIPIFLEQEVDIDLFMTLTDQDLMEIGIKDDSDRKVILNVINECFKSMM